MLYVNRANWGATAKRGPAMALPAREVWIHHSVTTATGDPAADMRTLERIGVQRFGRFSYSYAVHPNGTVLEGAGVTVGAHTANRNSTSFGIVWIGNYETAEPTGAQMEATAELIRWLVDVGHLRRGGPYPTGGHRDAPGASTACPGGNAYGSLTYLRALVSNGVPPPPPPVQEDDDMLIVRSQTTNRGIWFLSGDTIQHLRSTFTVTQLLTAGVKDVTFEDGDFDNLIKEKGAEEQAANVVHLDLEAIKAKLGA